MTSAFGLNGVALLHMLQQVSRELPILFVDTGYLYDETLETKQRIEQAYGLQVFTYHPLLSIEAQADQYGPELHAVEPNLCCALRKVEPMQRAMAEQKPVAVLNARARFQARTRADLAVVEWHHTPIRINPLAGWSRRQVEAYVAKHDVPHNPLHERGYPSIGCRPCTRPVNADEHIRAGRWAESCKSECGLWTAAYATAD
jgi:phosphoadenosine phosphosulfate reductase